MASSQLEGSSFILKKQATEHYAICCSYFSIIFQLYLVKSNLKASVPYFQNKVTICYIIGTLSNGISKLY
jgi:hypothetical protein